MDMKTNDVQRKRFLQAIECLTPQLQAIVLRLDEAGQDACEELRLRAGQPVHAQIDGRERALAGPGVTAGQLREVVSRAARYSVHSYGEALAQGYLPLEGGHRLGICGAAIVKNQAMAGIRTISSLNLRIAGPRPGICLPVLPQIARFPRVYNTLILSPPGFGKTTLLRDLICQISGQGVRVAVADERGELAALREGVAQFDIGPHTDVLEGCPKAIGVMVLLRVMSPAVIALDEITAPEDVQAISHAGHCGVQILATAHADGLDDLKRRPLYRDLLALSVFERVLCIAKDGGRRRYTVEQLGGN